MFSFSTTAQLYHATPLPPGTTLERAVSYLHNHDLSIRLDPDLAHYERLADDAGNAGGKRYCVTDELRKLPKGFWNPTFSYEIQITNTAEGISWVAKAPLGVSQKTRWRVVKTETVSTEHMAHVDESERGPWTLVEEVEVTANRMMMGPTKKYCEENWREMHGKYVSYLTAEGEPGAQAEGKGDGDAVLLGA